MSSPKTVVPLTIRFLGSKPFTFFLGSEKRPLVIQDGLFKGLSEPLHNRTPAAGNWPSDHDSIDDIKWEVFAALVDFAYSGDYWRSVPTVVIEHSSEQSSEDKSSRVEEQPLADEPLQEVNEDLDWGYPPPNKEKKKKSKKDDISWPSPTNDSTARSLWHSFNSNKPKDLAEENPSVHTRLLGPSQLLYHAEVCVAAERYLMSNLRHLSLQKLYQALLCLKPKPEEINGFLDLLRYVYIEEGVQGVPELKKMVLSYTAAKANIIRQDDRFKVMMHDIGEIGSDLVYEISSIDHWS